MSAANIADGETTVTAPLRAHVPGILPSPGAAFADARRRRS